MEELILDFEGNISVKKIYDWYLPKLNSYYKENMQGNNPIKNIVAPVISFENVSGFDADSIPLILSIGLLLYGLHQTHIELRLNHNTDCLYFLYKIGFFEIVSNGKIDNNTIKSKHLGIFNYNKELVGDFDRSKKIRKEHRIACYEPDLDKRLDDLINRDLYSGKIIEEIIEAVISNDVVVDADKVMKDKENNFGETYDSLLGGYGQIVSNAVIHSKSVSFGFIQKKGKKTVAAVSDVGIGLEKSLRDKDECTFPILNEYRKKLGEEYAKKLHGFLVIMDALLYSKDKSERSNRKNLWTVRNDVIKKKGAFSVRTENCEVIFYNEKCGSCKQKDDVFKCTECIMNSYTNAIEYSPLILYSGKLRGVHINIEL